MDAVPPKGAVSQRSTLHPRGDRRALLACELIILHISRVPYYLVLKTATRILRSRFYTTETLLRTVLGIWYNQPVSLGLRQRLGPKTASNHPKAAQRIHPCCNKARLPRGIPHLPSITYQSLPSVVTYSAPPKRWQT